MGQVEKEEPLAADPAEDERVAPLAEQRAAEQRADPGAAAAKPNQYAIDLGQE